MQFCYMVYIYACDDQYSSTTGETVSEAFRLIDPGQANTRGRDKLERLYINEKNAVLST